MILTKADSAQFIRLHRSLVYYIHELMRNEMVTGDESAYEAWLEHFEDDEEDFKEHILKPREFLYDHSELIGKFVSDNPFHFSPGELAIIRSWEHFVRGEFYVVRNLKKYTVFLSMDDDPRIFGVLGIAEDLDDMIGSRLPLMVNAVLLPFKDHIIYDGLLFYNNIYFGPGYRKSINATYGESKAKFGIITSLPFEEEEEEESDEDLLKFYLKSKGNREYYQEEIAGLLEKNPDLMDVFHLQMGKTYARTFKKELKEMGFSDVWFAVFNGLIIGSGKTKNALMANLQSVVPVEIARYVHVFRVK